MLVFGNLAQAATPNPTRPTFASATAARSGASNDVVEINGLHFAHVLSVKLSAPGVGTCNLKFIIVSSKTITATVPVSIVNKIKNKPTEKLRVDYVYRSIDYTWISGGIADTDNWSATT